MKFYLFIRSAFFLLDQTQRSTEKKKKNDDEKVDLISLNILPLHSFHFYFFVSAKFFLLRTKGTCTYT